MNDLEIDEANDQRDPRPLLSSGQRPTCSCGHDRDHFSVSPRPEFTAWGWFWNLFGVTAHPIRLRFVCRVCGEEIEVLNTRDEIARYW